MLAKCKHKPAKELLLLISLSKNCYNELAFTKCLVTKDQKKSTKFLILTQYIFLKCQGKST